MGRKHAKKTPTIKAILLVTLTWCWLKLDVGLVVGGLRAGVDGVVVCPLCSGNDGDGPHFVISKETILVDGPLTVLVFSATRDADVLTCDLILSECCLTKRKIRM